jgi:hypothetical protein
MNRFLLLLTLLPAARILPAQESAAAPPIRSLPEVRRIFVSELIGAEGDMMRGLIIAGLNSTRLFVLTDNPDRADAVLKGAADDKVFTDTLDIQEGISTHQNAGKGSSSYARTTNGIYGGIGISDSQSHHSKERKHEAYAAVRLCNKDGDVLWSTTQESLGAKFRGASADVAAKVAHQLTLDVERARAGESLPPANR